MYNSPRTATIRAKTYCKLWGLDRKTFNFIVKDNFMYYITFNTFKEEKRNTREFLKIS